MSASDELYDRRDKGWFHIDHALIEEYGPRIGAIGIAVYTYLVHKADREGIAWPSYSTIATALSLSRPTAIKTIRELAACGLIRVEVVRPKGKRAHNVYTLITIGKADLPVKEIYQSTGKGDLLVKDVSSIGKADLPVLVNDVDCIKNQESRTIEQETPPIVPPTAKPAAKPPTARGTRIPADFALTPKLHAYAAEKGVTVAEADSETEEFKLYWESASGAYALKTDWEKTWMRRILEQVKAGKIGPAARTGSMRSNGYQNQASINRGGQKNPDGTPRWSE